MRYFSNIVAILILALCGAACGSDSSDESQTGADGNGRNPSEQKDGSGANLDQTAPVNDRPAPMNDRPAPMNDRLAPMDREPNEGPSEATPTSLDLVSDCAAACARVISLDCVGAQQCTELCAQLVVGVCLNEAVALVRCASGARTCEEYSACEREADAFNRCVEQASFGATSS
jgi:hypothetical protein